MPMVRLEANYESLEATGEAGGRRVDVRPEGTNRNAPMACDHRGVGWNGSGLANHCSETNDT